MCRMAREEEDEEETEEKKEKMEKKNKVVVLRREAVKMDDETETIMRESDRFRYRR